jgi:hypothetical protein
MASLNLFGIGGFRRPRADDGATEFVQVQRPLRRVLAFRNRSIDDVVNDRFVKNEIYGYWKLHKQIERTSEIVDLERQWNPLRPG